MNAYSERLAGTILVLVILMCTTAWGPMGAPAPGPIGWEKQITPGFDPPIEGVLVYTVAWPHYSVKPEELPAKWGPEALPVLWRLFHSQEWDRYGADILQLIAGYRTEEARKRLVSEFLSPETKAPLKKDEEDRRLLLRAIGQMDRQTQKDVIAQVVQNSAHPAYAATVNVLCNDLYDGDSSARAPLERMLSTLPADSPHRSHIEHALKLDQPHQRAQEPMERILEKERKARP